ncbi:MAG: winged helix-turn-helix transcriptional regulator [Ruminococcaceae bacterium]|nr:winged helix-turn-helix transcriptional regulator [Oscillospiraceae bacterium]
MIDKSLGISYYISMDINIFGKKRNNSRCVRIISDVPEMQAMLETVLAPYFTLTSGSSNISVVCWEGEDVPSIGDACVYIGKAPKELSKWHRLLPRPLDIRELLDACLGLYEEKTSKKGSLWGIDEVKRLAFFDGREIPLTAKETELFSLLLESEGQCVKREKIESILWNGENSSNSCDVYVCFLRKKLEGAAGKGALLSVRSKGYMLKQYERNSSK